MRVEVIQIFAALAVASPVTTPSHVVHERRSIPPPQWSKQARLHPSAILPIRIGLAQQNLHRAEELMYQVSHPLSSSYGEHWSPQKVVEMFEPSAETNFVVKAWLASSGIEESRIKTSPSRNWLEFNATTIEAESLLRTEYHLYTHETGHSHVACEEYSIPSHLTAHVDIVTPTVNFDKRVSSPRRLKKHDEIPQPLQHLNKRAAGVAIVGSPNDASNPKQGATVSNALMTLETCDQMITPACLQALYNVPVGSKAAANNTLGVVEYTPQSFLQKDLDMWFEQFSPTQVGQSPQTQLIDGAVIQTTNQSFQFNGESSLDLEYAMGLIYPQQVTLFQVGDVVSGASFNNFLDAVDGSYCNFEGGDSKDPNIDGQYPSNIPGGFTGPKDCGGQTSTKVLSTSYGFNEADLSPAYVRRQCDEYMKLGLQGVTILYSSGDFGVAGNGGQCLGTNGAFNNGSSGMFNPSFPGTCPWVTSVGATQIVNGSTVRTPEIASQRVIFSGGGFSNVFAMPSYQQLAVDTYFTNNPMPYGAERFNNSRTVRGFPDVSANGVNYVVASNGQFNLAFGTSASCPTFGALVNMINEERIAVNKSPVGFINPALYMNPQVMTDIRFGGNQGCGTPGFNSTSGWDPVTGLGTPIYPAMLEMFMRLP